MAAATLLAAAACVPSTALEGRICPCADDYLCCNGLCLAPGKTCLAPAPDGASPIKDGPAELHDVTSTDDHRDLADDNGGRVDPGDGNTGNGDSGNVDSSNIDTGSADGGNAETSNVDGGNVDSGSDIPGDLPADRPVDVPEPADGDSPETPEVAPPPSWRLLDGLPASDLVATFDLRFGGDGALFLAVSRVIPGGGRARSIAVYRRDETGWVQLGADQPGAPYPISFALSPDDTPFLITNSGMVAFRAQQWQPLPALPDGTYLSTAISTLEFDRAGRLHTLILDAQHALGVARLAGSAWEPLGKAGSLGTTAQSPMLAFGATQVFVALTDLANFRTNVWRLGPTDWEPFGGDITHPLIDGVLNVTSDGTAYVTNSERGALTVNLSTGAPWQALDTISTPYNIGSTVPGVDLTSSGTMYIGYLGDRDPGPNITPGPMVSRRDGDHWTTLPSDDLDASVIDAIRLRVWGDGPTARVCLGYLRTNQLSVRCRR